MTNPLHRVRCFKRPDNSSAPASGRSWLDQWQTEFDQTSMRLPVVLQESLGHVMPLLMCGEQSAALVFNREANRDGDKRSAKLFNNIEAEELIHDDALQSIYSNLPVSPREAEVKRRAKRFYLAMGGGECAADELFARIQHLDSCVCVIMHCVENGNIGKHHPYAHIFRRIKQDEARHVAISRRHLNWLGGNTQNADRTGRAIRASLIDLLRPESDHLEVLGVDLDLLEKRLLLT